jgi:hypothetical protein
MLLCLQEFEEALAGFVQANELVAKRWSGANQPHWKAIGAIQWILGRPAEAILTLRRNVDWISDGTITYVESCKGARDGLLLWYVSVSAGDNVNCEHALSFLRGLDVLWLKEAWPGHIALWRLGEISKAEMRAAAADESKDAIDAEAAHRIQRRVKCNLLFYEGVCERETGHEETCLGLMRQCSESENPIEEEEWYLSHHEARRRNA